MSNSEDESSLLMEEACDLCDEIQGGIEYLRHLKSRFEHVWPSELDLEASSKRIARVRLQLREAPDTHSLRKLVAMLETEKANIVRDAGAMLKSEQQDRYRYR